MITTGALRMPAVLPRHGDVVLRPFRDDDVVMLCELATDPYVPLTGSLPADASREDALAYIARQHERLTSGAGYAFCVAAASDDRASSNRALGTAGLWLRDLAQGRATVGYSVAPYARRRGVAGQALQALTTFAWTIPSIFRIEAYTEPWNVGSIRVAESVGYAREGLLRSHQVIGGQRVDMLLYATVREDSR